MAALEEYEELLRGGQRPGRAEFLARHHSIADILDDRLDGLELVNGAIRPLAETGSISALIEDAFVPERLGEYRIIREVGRGGMGVVYEAEHLPLGRRVALKVLPSTASLDRRQRERFQVEAQAAALLHHEHIVPVFGIGCDQGIHYFAMQFIEGRSLTDVIRSLRPAPASADLDDTKTWDRTPVLPDVGSIHHSAGQSARPSLNDWQHCQRVAQLGLQAALALEHAHAIGVIHRDIKPSNLLIDARDHLWVADFGLARIPHENHDLTRTGDLVGTLRYMSPEQVRGERGMVDGRADIYALGATLYELLTLVPAYQTGDRNELVRRILDGEPTHLRRLNPSIPRDLETIILKAMEKEPAARYQSAQALADDLKRFLADQPIQARRPSLVDRGVKWSRRHRAIVVASTGALIVTFAASTAVLWAANRRLETAQNVVARSVNLAQMTIDHSLETIDQIIRPLTENVADSAGEDTSRTLRKALEYYDKVAETCLRDERMHEVSAKAFRRAGRARMLLGRSRGRADYRTAIRMYEQIAARSPHLLWLPAGLIETLQEYARLLKKPADAAEAESLFRRAISLAEPWIDNESIDPLCFSVHYIGPFNNLAWDLVRRRPARAGDAALATRLARRAVDWEPEQPAYWKTLGVAHYRAGEWGAARNALQRAIELGKGGTAADGFLLACVYHQQGNTTLGRRLYERALASMRTQPVMDEAQAADLAWIRQETASVFGSTDAGDDQVTSTMNHF